MTTAPSLLSRLAPPPRPGAVNSSTGALAELAGSGAPSPIVQRTRTRGARNRNQTQPQSQSQSQLSSSHPTATQHDSPAPRVKAPPKATGIPAATTKPTTDLATSRWAITPPPSPPLSKSPQAKFKPNPDTVAKSCFSSSPPSTSHDAKTNEGTSSEAINAIDGMLAKLRNLDVSPPSTQPATAPPRKTSTAPSSSVPPKTSNTVSAKQPALGGRSMWADDSDDDEHAKIPDTYNALFFETNKSMQLESAAKISTTPKPTPIPPTPVVSIPSSTPSPPTAKSSLPIVKLPSSPPVQVQKPLSRSSTPPPASNPSVSPPATPTSHINWADDDDQDGELPELEDDWLVSATTTTTTNTTTSNMEIDDLGTRASGLSISPTSAGSASSPPSLEGRFARRGVGGVPNIGASATGRGGAGSRSGAAPARRTRGNDSTLLKAGSTSPPPASGRTGKGPPPSTKTSDHPGSRQAIPPSPRKLRSDRDPPPHVKPTRGAPPPSSSNKSNPHPPPSSIEPQRLLSRTRVPMNPSANLFGRLTGIKKEGPPSGTVAGGTGGAGVR
ncbi:BQ5605_C002g01514 [Microbotryum silenes-dioicae]|uniref:BQ5605_C002g01514 protein n=1 Tax=Microbotryum silenes-dioicae TaxID=796604 RepID=A0A2X0NWH3_9BASI|nr:BQ5605_C002g01514 [Microbotryum silenes-dioicae]